MDINQLDRKFRRMGARVRVGTLADRTVRDDRRVAIDIRRDAEGEYFEIRVPERDAPRVDAVDVRPRLRHLLLMVRARGAARSRSSSAATTSAHWFVAAVPEAARVGDRPHGQGGPQARRGPAVALRHGVRPRDRNRRKNAAYVRQGEWFFLPQPDLRPDAAMVLRDEPSAAGQRRQAAPGRVPATGRAARRSTSAPSTPTA